MARRDLLLALASGAAGAALFGLLSRWAKRARRGHGAAWLKAEAGSGDRPRVALVAAGSVAAVKVPELATRLADELGAQVAVVLTGGGRFMTSSEIARRYAREHFVAFEAALRAKRDVFLLEDCDEWEGYADVSVDPVVHIELRKWADVVLVAPCSANTLAKVALGLCDNLATCLLRAWDPDKPMLLAPAMNTVMWEHPSTLQHLRILEDRGCRIIAPTSKRLACGDVGRGALAPVDEILRTVQACSCPGLRGSGVGAWQRHGFQEWQPKEYTDTSAARP